MRGCRSTPRDVGVTDRVRTRIEVDGEPATLDLLPFPDTSYGHFTAMQVRGGRTRGLALHLARLDGATRELFGRTLPGGRVRDAIRHALGRDGSDASVRVYVCELPPRPDVSVIVTVRPPADTWDHPVHLRSVPYVRAVANIKRLSDFGQTYHRGVVQRAGADDALLTGADGTISECGIANIAFADADAASIVWPDAPQLEGITKQVVEPRLGAAGLASVRRHVRLADVPSFRSAIVTNARGVAPVGRIDDTALVVDDGLLAVVRAAYDGVPWDAI